MSEKKPEPFLWSEPPPYRCSYVGTISESRCTNAAVVTLYGLGVIYLCQDCLQRLAVTVAKMQKALGILPADEVMRTYEAVMSYSRPIKAARKGRKK